MQDRGAKQQDISPCVHARTKGKIEEENKDKNKTVKIKSSLHSQVA